MTPRLGDRHTHGRPLRRTLQRDLTTERGQCQIVGDPLGGRAIDSERGHYDMHDGGIEHTQVGKGPAIPTEPTRRRRLDQDVGATHEVIEQRPVLWLVRIDHDRALVRVVRKELEAAIRLAGEVPVVATQEGLDLVAGGRRDVRAAVAVHVPEHELRHVEEDLEVALQGDQPRGGDDQVIGPPRNREAGRGVIGPRVP